MNKLEAAYDSHLALLELGGAIQGRRFEAVKLRLAAKATWYTPDFMVFANDGLVEFHEVKGFWRDDARLKWKVAGETFPEFRFIAITLLRGKRGEWVFEEFD